MKISILLPLKENFSPKYPGAVSLNINDTLKISKYKNKIKAMKEEYILKKDKKLRNSLKLEND